MYIMLIEVYRLLLLLHLLLFTAFLPVSSSASSVIKIGCGVSLTGQLAINGKRIKQGLQTWQRKANEAGGVTIGGVAHTFEVIFKDDQSNMELLPGIYADLVGNENVVFLMGPMSSASSFKTAAYAHANKMFAVLPAAGSSSLYNATKFGYHVGVVSQAGAHMESLLNAFKARGAKDVFIISQDDIFSLGVAKGAKAWAEANGMTTPVNISLVRTCQGSTKMREVVEEAGLYNADVLLHLGHLDEGVNFARELDTLSHTDKAYYPRAVALGALSLADLIPQRPKSSLNGFCGSESWNERVKYQSDPGQLFKDASDFHQEYLKDFPGETIDRIDAQGAIAGIILQRAIEKAQSLDSTLVRQAAGQLNDRTFYGELRFSEDGLNIGHVPVGVQYLTESDKRYVVAPDDASSTPIVYPIPWSRNCNLFVNGHEGGFVLIEDVDKSIEWSKGGTAYTVVVLAFVGLEFAAFLFLFHCIRLLRNKKGNSTVSPSISTASVADKSSRFSYSKNDLVSQIKPSFLNAFPIIAIFTELIQVGVIVLSPELPWNSGSQYFLETISLISFSYRTYFWIMLTLVLLWIVYFIIYFFDLDKVLDRHFFGRILVIPMDLYFPLGAGILFIPAMSVFMESLQCVWFKENDLVVLNQWCDTLCWSSTHVGVAIPGTLLMILFYPLAAIAAPVWQAYNQDFLDVKYKNQFLMHDVLFKGVIVSLRIFVRQYLWTFYAIMMGILSFYIVFFLFYYPCRVAWVNNLKILIYLMFLSITIVCMISIDHSNSDSSWPPSFIAAIVVVYAVVFFVYDRRVYPCKFYTISMEKRAVIRDFLQKQAKELIVVGDKEVSLETLSNGSVSSLENAIGKGEHSPRSAARVDSPNASEMHISLWENLEQKITKWHDDNLLNHSEYLTLQFFIFQKTFMVAQIFQKCLGDNEMLLKNLISLVDDIAKLTDITRRNELTLESESNSQRASNSNNAGNATRFAAVASRPSDHRISDVNARISITGSIQESDDDGDTGDTPVVVVGGNRESVQSSGRLSISTNSDAGGTSGSTNRVLDSVKRKLTGGSDHSSWNRSLLSDSRTPRKHSQGQGSEHQRLSIGNILMQ
eukprot:Nk52_evm35s212 gene=Nk52_evmTU35s212